MNVEDHMVIVSGKLYVAAAQLQDTTGDEGSVKDQIAVNFAQLLGTHKPF